MSLPVAIALTRRLALLVCRCGDAVGGAFLPGKIVALFFICFYYYHYFIYVALGNYAAASFMHPSKTILPCWGNNGHRCTRQKWALCIAADAGNS